MTRSCITLTLALLVIAAPLAQTESDAARLVGTYRLVSMTTTDGAGTIVHPLGEDVTGRLMYDEHGQMSAHLMRPGRANFAKSELQGGTPEEALTAFNGYVGYYGHVTVDEARQEVTHHLVGAWFPNWVGTTLTRRYRLEGTRLTLYTPPMEVGGQRVVSVVVRERIP